MEKNIPKHMKIRMHLHTMTGKSLYGKIFVHELGHLLGLEHPWDKDDGDWAVTSSEEPTIDTVMGYKDNSKSGEVMDWFQEIDAKALREIWGTADSPTRIDITESTSIAKPSKFMKKAADKILNFNSLSDTLEIDDESFSINGTATFSSDETKKEVKKKLAKKDFNFLYDEKKGGL